MESRQAVKNKGPDFRRDAGLEQRKEYSRADGGSCTAEQEGILSSHLLWTVMSHLLLTLAAGMQVVVVCK